MMGRLNFITSTSNVNPDLRFVLQLQETAVGPEYPPTPAE